MSAAARSRARRGARLARWGVVLALLVPWGWAAATPFVPADGRQVLEVLPWRSDPEQRELRGARAALAAHPGDVGQAVALARRYLAVGRREADPRYFGYAQAALAPWWTLPAPPPQVRLLRASLLQTEHRFDAALADLDGVIAADPGNAQAWLTRATVQTVRADYAGATASCARLSSLTDDLVSMACIANVGSLTGRSGPSAALLATAYARGSGIEPAVDTWVLTMLAEIEARRNDAADAARADAHFRAALARAPRDVYLLGSYADFLLDQQRAREAEALLRKDLRVDGLLLRHALALRALGRDARAETDDLAARFDAAERRGNGVHLREQARFELELRGAPARALVLAQRNWREQREPADARVLLAAAGAARDRAAAQPVLDWLAASHIEDPILASLAARLTSGGRS
jgi:cytochrome c-type biogenesis protein CcmH/NrfG